MRERQPLAPIITAVALAITALASLVAAAGAVYNGRNLQRVERNTNSLSERNEAIAKKLGVQEGKAEEKANPSP